MVAFLALYPHVNANGHQKTSPSYVVPRLHKRDVGTGSSLPLSYTMEAEPQVVELDMHIQFKVAGLNLNVQVQISKRALAWLLGGTVTGSGIAAHYFHYL
jgi:hypothetical protein